MAQRGEEVGLGRFQALAQACFDVARNRRSETYHRKDLLGEFFLQLLGGNRIDDRQCDGRDDLLIGDVAQLVDGNGRWSMAG